MSGRICDIAIAGGGLAGGLIALAVQRERPEFKIRLVESGETLGGNHRWSWFASDIDTGGSELLEPFRKTEWSDGYDVIFPAHRRKLSTPYRSLSSADFHATLLRELHARTIVTNREVVELDMGGIDLANGERIAARTVIDARGLDDCSGLTGGWQVFMGRHLKTAKPHGLDRPIIMDADVEQHGAYRFVYTLPLSSHDLFVEDTYYADSAFLDRSALSRRIDEYCAQQGWDGDILGGETGVLPVITGGNFAQFHAAKRTEGVALAGARGGFVHPLTSYTFPHAVRIAQVVAANADLPGPQLAALLEAQSRNHWRSMRFYRRLGAMLFRAAKPDLRYRIFERFYRLDEGLIERFYAGNSTRADRARVLCGKPPVPVSKAIYALATRGRPLTKRAAR